MKRTILLLIIQLIVVNCPSSAQNSAAPMQSRIPYAPVAPIAPKSSQECSAFQSQVAAFKAEKVREHDVCRYRSGYKVDRPNADQSTTCAVSACQELHEWAYGNAAAGLDQEVSACNANVQTYQNRQVAQTEGIQSGVAALLALIASAPATPIDSQADLANFDQQAANQAVVGDNSNSKLGSTAEVQALVQSKDQQGDSNEALDAMTAEAEKSEDNPDTSQAMKAAGESVKEFLQGATKIWSDSKELKELAEPFIRLQDALDMADVAQSGRVPTTFAMVDKLASYVDKQQNALETLARNSPNDWLASSGLNEFNRAGTVSNAQQYLDAWSQRLSSVQQLVQNAVPTLQVAQRILDNDVVNGGRMALQGSEAGLDPIAMQDLINQLKYCSSKIDAIQNNLQSARSVVH